MPKEIILLPSLRETEAPLRTPSTQVLTTVNGKTMEVSSDIVSNMIEQVDKPRVQVDLLKLTGEETICSENDCHIISNRLSGSKELGWAKEYIKKELDRLGYAVEFFGWSRDGYSDQNIIARKKSYLGQLSPKELSLIKYVINIDMIGYDANQDWVIGLWHGGHSSSLDLAELLNDTIRDYQLNLIPKFAVGCG